jgi:hypothetical protein
MAPAQEECVNSSQLLRPIVANAGREIRKCLIVKCFNYAKGVSARGLLLRFVFRQSAWQLTFVSAFAALAPSRITLKTVLEPIHTQRA